MSVVPKIEMQCWEFLSDSPWDHGITDLVQNWGCFCSSWWEGMCVRSHDAVQITAWEAAGSCRTVGTPYSQLMAQLVFPLVVVSSDRRAASRTTDTSLGLCFTFIAFLCLLTSSSFSCDWGRMRTLGSSMLLLKVWLKGKATVSWD